MKVEFACYKSGCSYRQSDSAIQFKKAGVPVWGEIELAYNYDKGKVALQ